MILQNLHTHSTFCDGKNTLEEMIETALELKFSSIGFSRHACMPFESSFCKGGKYIQEYKEKARALQEKFKEQIDIFVGTEYDLYSIDSLEGYDYVIGSFHYFLQNGEYIPFDRDAAHIKKIFDTYFDSNPLKMAKAFYEETAKLASLAPDVIGHFDLVAKHTPTLNIIDEDDKAYQSIAIEALRELSKKTQVFEINVGCVARGYKKSPYLAPFIVKELKRLGCQITISSDCHDKNHFDANWNMAIERLLDCGYKNIAVFTKEGFKEAALI